MTTPRVLTPQEARRAAVRAQLLSGPRPTDLVDTVRHLWMLQMDPTRAVERTEHLVLFSRLGPRYRPRALERALWEDRTLFEYRAFILPVSDFPMHRETMRRYPPANGHGRQLRAAGIATAKSIGWLMDGLKPPGWERALDRMIREGTAVPCRVQGVKGEWLADATALEGPFRPRTVLLSPFDRLIRDRARGVALLEFDYKLEIYVPPVKRKDGYYVLPILHGDRLIGGIDSSYDRNERVYEVRKVFAESDAPTDAGPAVRRAIEEMGRWLGARETRVRSLPPAWRG